MTVFPHGRIPQRNGSLFHGIAAFDARHFGKDVMSQPKLKATEATASHPAGKKACGLCQKLSEVKVVQSSELLQGQRQMMIVHDGCVYRLICTRNNKLILQK
jgi:hemin uptake protein HemP